MRIQLLKRPPTMNRRERGYSLGAPSETATAVEALNVLAKELPSPTNAQALAALSAFHQHDSADAARNAGVRGDLAAAYLMPLGILPRMRLLAFGWEKPGDALKSATDAAWWKRTYTSGGFNPRRLWEPLGTYVDKVAADKVWSWDQALADGDAQQLARQRNQVADELRIITDEHADICAPYLIPIRRGVVPTLEAICANRILVAKRGKEVERTIPRLKVGLPWWVIATVVIVAFRELDRR